MATNARMETSPATKKTTSNPEYMLVLEAEDPQEAVKQFMEISEERDRMIFFPEAEKLEDVEAKWGIDPGEQPRDNDLFSARARFPGGRITRRFVDWLAECERNDQWHDSLAEGEEINLGRVMDFLGDDYCDWGREG